MKLDTRMQPSKRKTTPIVSFSHRFSAEIDDTPSSVASADAPSVVESDVSSDEESVGKSDCSKVPPRQPLQWEFKGLTLWVEFEEFDSDLTRAIDHFVRLYGTECIPVPHATVAYGMAHLTDEEALSRLRMIPKLFPHGWPSLVGTPVGVKQDIAVEGRPGQVCDIAWAELTLPTNDQHEEALNKLHELYDLPKRQGPWTPHCSIAYDNPEDHVLTLAETLMYVAKNPTLMKPRRIKSIALWSTRGKMGAWKCLDRVNFF